MARGDVYAVIKPRAWLLREPSKNAPQETELLFGHRFQAETPKAETQNTETQKTGWVYGRALSPLGQKVDGYKGWMRLKTLAAHAPPSTHYIGALKAPVFSKASIKSRIKRILPLNAQISGSKDTASFIKLASGGFMHERHLQTLGHYAQSDFAAAAARHYGLPYIWGGVSTDGLDCSGLVQSALRAVGTDCLRDAGQQEASLGTRLPAKAELTRGDLVFWPGHVGIMEDGATLLHANGFHMKVEREPLKTAIARIGEPSSLKRLGPRIQDK